jgi:hypothetical protein
MHDAGKVYCNSDATDLRPGSEMEPGAGGMRVDLVMTHCRYASVRPPGSGGDKWYDFKERFGVPNICWSSGAESGLTTRHGSRYGQFLSANAN